MPSPLPHTTHLPIIDLHCDLLLYLQEDRKRTAYHPESRSAIPQLQTGGVHTQVMAIYTPTEKGSSKQGLEQLAIFQNLPKMCPEFVFAHFNQHPIPLSTLSSLPQIQILPAIENTSSLCEEDEPLQCLFDRLNQMEKTVAKPLYISLTWNMENRFGGGALSQVGLKEDGKQLLNFLHDKEISVDLSHTSDPLAHDILNHLDKYRLNIPVIASHSNFRKICQVPRNLPDDLALEIFKRGGIIGLNWIRSMVGPTFTDLAKHLEHALSLGGEGKICFGADFFYENSIPDTWRKPVSEYYFDDCPDASCYPKVLALYQKELGLSHELLAGLASQNFLDFRHALRLIPKL